MFRKLKDGSIESDLGFTIRVLGRAGLEYKEGGKILEIDSEMLADSKFGYVVASSSISTWKGSTKRISIKDRQRIMNNIKKAFRFIGYKTQIIDRF